MANIRKIFEGLMGIRMYSEEIITQGAIYSSYIVNDTYYLRVKNKKIIPFYNSKDEQEILNEIKPFNIDFSYRAFDSRHGNHVSIYEPLARNFNYHKYDLNQLKTIANTMRKLHSIDTKIERKFDYLKRLKYYQTNCLSTTTITKLNDEVINLAEKYFNDGMDLKLCHNNLNSNNIMFIEDEVRFIDYDFAALNDPLFDIATFLSANSITDMTMIKVFLKEYYDKTVDNEVITKLEDYFLLVDYLWYFWGLYMFKLTRDFTYQDFANIKRIRAINHTTIIR